MDQRASTSSLPSTDAAALARPALLPHGAYVLGVLHCLCPFPDSQPRWPAGRSGPLLWSDFPREPPSPRSFFFPGHHAALDVLLPQFLYYLVPVSSSPKADKEEGVRGSVRETGARGGGKEGQ